MKTLANTHENCQACSIAASHKPRDMTASDVFFKIFYQTFPFFHFGAIGLGLAVLIAS